METTKTTQAIEITSLKRRVKKLERRNKSRTYGLKRLYKVGSSRRVKSSDEECLGEEDASKQGRIADIDADARINLVSTHFDADTDMFGVHDLDSDEVLAEPEVAVKDVNLSVDEVTLAQALKALKSAKVQEKANVVEEPSESIITTPTLTTTTAATTITAVSTRPRAKGLVIHKQEQAPTPTVSSQQPSHVKAQDKGKGIMVEEPVVEQAKHMKRLEQMRLDEELAFKIQAEEEEEEERIAREKAQQIEKANITWDDVQAKIDDDYQLAKRIQDEEQEQVTDAEKARLSSKRAGEELEKESIKKQKVDEDKETLELQSLTEIVPDEEEVAIDAIPLATKSPSIVDWKIHKEGKKTYYQIIKDDRSSKMYLVFSHMLKSFDREDLETLWKLVKAKHGSTRLEEVYERVLWGDLKTMFDPHVEDTVWRNQQDYRVLDWKIYDSCGFHSLRMQHMHIHMLVD
ncbi:hypothetical protein Tco_0956919 [Tanacetum coccineum]